ncbi:zinc finger protein 208-like [Mizuhopecten yessoensis]|uniref:Zinc finger protein 91 n=1 Tax=Mizuhopecten yessoensis TaxID=6573 RepID=A0A210PDY6_MIZYE|nr:zinc finger protein 208-like [Mizuhopecten yessoensis]OWF34703.1 Zinc finger protein 91 [Mizuhopecten yessoensis]
MKHHRAEHVNKKLHKCDMCGKQFSSLKGLKAHMFVHMNDKKYICEICGKRFVQTIGLKMHMEFHQQSIKCDKCGRCFSKRAQLSLHMKIHLRTVFPKCEFCDKSFKTKGVLQRHMRSFHTIESCDICGLQIHRQLMGNHKLAHEYESNSRYFICSICEDSFKTADSFRTHLEIHKDVDRPYACEICGKTFIAIKSIKDHARSHIERSDILQDSKDSDKNGRGKQNLQMLEDLEDSIVEKVLFPCDLCGKIFSRKCLLDVHLRIHQIVEKNCDKCEKTFKTEIALKNHIDLAHNEKPCEVCGKILTKGELKRHMAEHILKKQYQCDMCFKQFPRLSGLKRHMTVHVNDKKYICDICGKRFEQTTGLKMHMRFHQQSIKCEKCGRCFSKRAQLSLHMKIHLRTVFPKCEYCDKTFKTKGVLQRHMRSYHTTESCDICGLQIHRQLMGNHKLAHEYESNSRDFICSICEDSFKTADSFRTHLEIHKDEDRPYTCEICGKTFIAIKSITDHARLHIERSNTNQDSKVSDKNGSGKKTLQMHEDLEDSIVAKTKLLFPCDLCGKTFLRKCLLDVHLRIHQNVEKNCDKCEKTYKTEIALKNHIDLAHNEKPCEVCGKILTKGELKRHMAEHILKKQYQCDMCFKQFPRLSGLKRHMTVHVNDKKYICDICGKRFVQTTGLKMHMRFHQQSIKCEKCGRCFSKRAQLSLHMKIHLRTVFPKCEYCDKTFKTKGVLQRHMRSYHTAESCDICGLQIHRQLMGNHKLAHEYESNSRDFICSICEDSFKTADSFQTHLEIHKDEDRPYTCEICGKTFIAIKSITDHTRLHIERSNTNQGSKDSDKNGRSEKNLQMPEELEDSIAAKTKLLFPCDLCGKTFLRKCLLDVHLRIHRNVEKNCDKCEKTFKTEIALKNHIDLAHNEKPCKVCGKILTKGELKHHRAEHVNKKLHKCDVCGKQFSGLKGLKTHMSVHVNDKKYSCDICGKRFVQTTGLSMHMRFHQQSIKCDSCGRCFSTRGQLSSHMKIHLRTEFQKCEICAKSYKSKVVLQRHMRSFHTTESCDICGLQINRQLIGNHKLAHENESNSRYFICSVCEDCFKTADSFRTHLEIHKNDDRPYTCEVCGKTFITVKNLRSHVRWHRERFDTHQDSATSYDKKGSSNKNLQMSELENSFGQKTKPVFTCDLCGKVFQIDRHLQNHIKKVHRVLPSYICGENIAHNQMSLQKKTVHQSDCICDICGVSFPDLIKLKRHSEKHRTSKFHAKPTMGSTVEENFKCDICCKEFTSSRKLFCHRKFHKNTCNICGKCFSGKTALSTHMLRYRSKTHVTICKQKYKCSVCRRQLRTKLHLRNHYRMHIKLEKAVLKCEGCALTFTSKEKREAHFNALHVKKPCNICKKKFLTVLLKGHKKLHDLGGKRLISKDTQDKVKILKGKRGHKRESMIPYLKPKEINMDSILMKKAQISNLSSEEQESLNDDRNFFNCIVRRCIDELGITSIKGDNLTRLKSKVKEWLLNVNFDKADISIILKTTASKNISYNKRRRASMSK